MTEIRMMTEKKWVAGLGISKVIMDRMLVLLCRICGVTQT